MREIKNYAYIENLELYEYVAFPIYVIIIYLISYYIQNKNIKKNPVYRYYTKGVLFKLLGAIIFCFVYIFYYKGGDTISYYETSRSLTNLFLQKPADFLKVILEKPSVENYFLFDGRTTGFPWPYMFYDTKTFFVAKLLVPFMVVSFQSYILCSLLLSWISFIGIWKLYLILVENFKQLSFQLALAILFVPSVIFWGSGILKDTITLSATCWMIYSIYNLFIMKRGLLKNSIIFLISGYVIVSVKPYIMIALIPGAFIWIMHYRIVKIKNAFFRYSAMPFIFIAGFVLGFFILSSATGFNLEKAFYEASEKQNDLKQSYYKGNTFDIGSYDYSVGGILSKAPNAILSGIFRPFIWESKTVMMLITGIENTLFLYLSLRILLGLKLKKLLRIIFNTPYILFSLSYSILFAFIIGMSTANFGALVRFKIAFLPQFASAITILYYLVEYEKKKKV